MVVRVNRLTFHCSSRKAGVGQRLLLDRPVYSLNSERGETAILAELNIGAHLVRSTLGDLRDIQTLVVVSSLPRTHRALIGASLMNATGIGVSGVIEFGGHCGAVLDALHYLFCTSLPNDRRLMIVLDSFMTSYGASSSGEFWRDGGGAVYVNPYGDWQIELISYVSGFDSSFLSIAHAPGSELFIPLVPDVCIGFSDADEHAMRSVFKLALEDGGLDINNLNGVVVVNRSENAHMRLRRVVEGVQIFESRVSNSHIGGADLIANLCCAVDAVGAGVFCIMGFGFGYSWQAMMVKVSL